MKCLCACFAAVLAIACNGVHSNPIVQDAPPDVPDIDAPVDAPPVLAAHHYIIDKQVIPTTMTEARNNAIDVNGDAQDDNQLGLVMATLSGQGYDVTGDITRQVDRGQILQLVQFESNGFVTGPARFTLFGGATPNPAPCNGGADTVCRHHLAGTGTFTLAPGTERDTPLAGKLASGAVLTTPDADAKLELHTALGTDSPLALHLVNARVKVTAASDNVINGIVGGGVLRTDIDSQLLPAWRTTINALIARDCPGAPPDCGCGAGSQGKVVQQLFDLSPRDCTVSLTELQNNTFLNSLLAPDLTVNGKQALSLSVAFTGVPATFTP